MKKKVLLILGIVFASTASIPLYVSLIGTYTFGTAPHVLEHYKDESNFRTVEVKVTESGFTEIRNDDSRYGKYGFWKTNQEFINDTSFYSDVSIGDLVTITSTDGYFWDGFTKPIVHLEFNGLTYLNVEIGKSNLIHDLEIEVNNTILFNSV